MVRGRGGPRNAKPPYPGSQPQLRIFQVKVAVVQVGDGNQNREKSILYAPIRVRRFEAWRRGVVFPKYFMYWRNIYSRYATTVIHVENKLRYSGGHRHGPIKSPRRRSSTFVFISQKRRPLVSKSTPQSTLDIVYRAGRHDVSY